MSFELQTSPYFKNSYIINYPDGRLALYRNKLEYSPKVDDEYLVTIEGDTLDAIAFRKYGDSKLWWVIADVNNIENPLIIEPGTSLLIPKLSHIPNV